MGHCHHRFRVVEIVVRFLSHGASAHLSISNIKNKATTTTESENPELCTCDYSVIDDAGWHLASLPETSYEIVGINSGNIASNLISVNQHTTLAIFIYLPTSVSHL